MVTVVTLICFPAIAALAAFLLMERTWWWGPAAVAALALGGLVVPFLLFAAVFVAIGWVAAQIGTAILMDESVVAAVVYFATATLLVAVLVIAPDGTIR